MTSPAAWFRLARAGWVLVREGVVSALPGDQFEGPPRAAWRLAGLFARPRARGRERKQSMAEAIDRLGPSYVKLGQFLATRPDVVGAELARDLAALQDRMPTFPTQEAARSIEESLGRPLGALYHEFGEPVAAASIAQVHPARIERAGGEAKVAVKVIRPGVRVRFNQDLEAYFLAARLQERLFPASRRLKPVEVTELLAQTTRVEMDLRLEAAAISEMGENVAADPGFRVPWVDWERTGRDVVTMEWVEGAKLSDMAAVKAAGHDPAALAATLMQSFLRHALRDGFFHADMHPGNLLVEPDGTLVAVDFGITGRLGKKERRFLAEILYGFIARDYRRVAEVHFEAGYVPRSHDVRAFAQAIRAIGEPIHGQSADTISMAKLLSLLFEVTEIFDMAARTELLMLQKTMVVVEGVCRALDPHFNMWKVSEPVVGDWIRDNLGPRGMLEDAREGIAAALSLARQAPDLSARAERLSREIDAMAENGLRFDARTAEAIGRAEARHARWGRAALWVIALALLVIAFD